MLRLLIAVISVICFKSANNLINIENKSNSIEEIEGRFAFETQCDSCYLNFWGQNYNSYARYGFWKIDENLNVKFEKGFFCFFDPNSIDSIVIQSKKIGMVDQQLLLNVKKISFEKKLVSINLSSNKNSTRLTKQLNSNRVRRDNLSGHTIFRTFTNHDLNYQYRIINVKMKVKRKIDYDFERCVYSKKGINHFKKKSIPYYQILEIDSIW